jgi:hypothetical protein
MRFVHLYLLGYFLLVIGAGLALWQAGILARISTIWLMIAAIIIVGLGILLAATSTRTTTITRE